MISTYPHHFRWNFLRGAVADVIAIFFFVAAVIIVVVVVARRLRPEPVLPRRVDRFLRAALTSSVLRRTKCEPSLSIGLGAASTQIGSMRFL